jgi:hypothetical protein
MTLLIQFQQQEILYFLDLKQQQQHVNLLSPWATQFPKGRFRILTTGVRVHGVEATDKIWLTCCALHNFVLEADGLNEQWNNGLPSDWEGDLGRVATAHVM